MKRSIAELSRRTFLTTSLVAAAGLAIHPGPSFADSSGKSVEDTTPNEDLMREHGLLDRVLLIYEEGARSLSAGKKFDVTVLRTSAEIVRDFIESYHEKLEEEFLFPLLRKANREVELVSTLEDQHKAGRRTTNRIIGLAGKAGNGHRELVVSMKAFIFMYRPHAAREDTILFPAFKEVVGKKVYQELGDQFEEREHKLFGKDGFEGVLAKVAGLEKQIGIYELSHYTPKGA